MKKINYMLPVEGYSTVRPRQGNWSNNVLVKNLYFYFM
eukprot:SAG11_NODE_27853_length_328_cov_0.689956_1_plen_37_part_10